MWYKERLRVLCANDSGPLYPPTQNHPFGGALGAMWNLAKMRGISGLTVLLLCPRAKMSVGLDERRSTLRAQKSHSVRAIFLPFCPVGVWRTIKPPA